MHFPWNIHVFLSVVIWMWTNWCGERLARLCYVWTSWSENFSPQIELSESTHRTWLLNIPRKPVSKKINLHMMILTFIDNDDWWDEELSPQKNCQRWHKWHIHSTNLNNWRRHPINKMCDEWLLNGSVSMRIIYTDIRNRKR